ncbi:glycosyltransferase family 9 protein [Halobacteriovorax sp. HLS]|uniref:glycosyltransferase family 9 protein n=1 Tax=Halobacteriovorax sp. HLS TaxID=2234000 RepID=UPI000FDA5D81|nr:glycosyltransferase family 9 protein [Halobacteriovorax sp. HLS]
MEKILIIKTGHSETFAEQVSGEICSLGDVLRTIPIVCSGFPSNMWSIDWLTDHKALELFDVFDKEIGLKIIGQDIIDKSSYDIVLNLEKGYSIEGGNVYGFTSSSTIRKIGHDSSSVVQFPILDDYSIEQKFYEYFNIKTELSELRINSKLKTSPIYKYGLNWKAGPKWPQKILPKEYWTSWYDAINESSSVSWQEGFDSINEYISWIAKCETIITLDSLGLHVANILGKRTIALYGPTPCEKSIYPNERMVFYYRNTEELKNLETVVLDFIKND